MCNGLLQELNTPTKEGMGSPQKIKWYFPLENPQTLITSSVFGVFFLFKRQEFSNVFYNFLKDRIKGTNGRQKTYEIFHVYCIFYSGFMCQTTVIFGITKDGSLVLNTLASWNCFTCRNSFKMALTICQNV